MHVCPDHLRGAFHLCLTFSGVQNRCQGAGVSRKHYDSWSLQETKCPGSLPGMCYSIHASLLFHEIIYALVYPFDYSTKVNDCLLYAVSQALCWET